MTTVDTGRARSGPLARIMPIFDWLPHYKAAWLSADLIAGASVWALVVPQAIAYAAIVGVPAQYGLYTVLGACAVYALFASTRQVVTGPSATVSAVVASVMAMFVVGNSSEYLGLVVALTLVAGLIYVLLGVLRLGWLSNFLSKAVLEGFVFAFGFGLIADQLHKVLGVPKVEGSYWQVLVGTLKELPETNPYTFAVGATGIVLLLLMRYRAKKLPRSLIVVVLGIAASLLLGLSAYGVAVVGPLPSGLPSVSLPSGVPSSDWATLALGALAVILVGFSESLAASREMAAKHKLEVTANQELIAQGAGTLGSALLGGFPPAGSLSKTSVADGAGQKTQLAALVVAALTVVTLLFLTGLFASLPKAILGAVVIDAAVGLIDFAVPARFRRVRTADFAAFVAAAVGLFFIGVVAGVIIGAILSLLLLIATVSRSPLRRYVYDEAVAAFVLEDEATTPKQIAGVEVVGIEGPLFFADAETFRSGVRQLVADAPVAVDAVVLELGATSFVDSDGAEAIAGLQEDLLASGTHLRIARADVEVSDVLSRAGVVDKLGEDAFFKTARDAVFGAGDAGAVESGAGEA